MSRAQAVLSTGRASEARAVGRLGDRKHGAGAQFQQIVEEVGAEFRVRLQADGVRILGRAIGEGGVGAVGGAREDGGAGRQGDDLVLV